MACHPTCTSGRVAIFNSHYDWCSTLGHLAHNGKNNGAKWELLKWKTCFKPSECCCGWKWRNWRSSCFLCEHQQDVTHFNNKLRRVKIFVFWMCMVHWIWENPTKVDLTRSFVFAYQIQGKSHEHQLLPISFNSCQA